MLVGIDVVNVMGSYLSVVQACGSPHACTTDRYDPITLTTSIPTNTEKPYFVILAKHGTAPCCWFLRELKHVGESVIILNYFNNSMIL